MSIAVFTGAVKTTHRKVKGFDVSTVSPPSLSATPKRTELDELAIVIRNAVLSDYSLIPWSHLPDRDRAKWREGAFVATRMVLDAPTTDHELARATYDRVTAGYGATPWHLRRDCERVRWLAMAPIARRLIEAQQQRPAPRPTHAVAIPAQPRPTLRERWAERMVS